MYLCPWKNRIDRCRCCLDTPLRRCCPRLRTQLRPDGPLIVDPTLPVVVATPSSHGGHGHCTIDALKLRACANVLSGLVDVKIGHGPADCCQLLRGIADLDAAIWLCTTVKANVLGIGLNLPVDLSTILNKCGKRPAQLAAVTAVAESQAVAGGSGGAYSLRPLSPSTRGESSGDGRSMTSMASKIVAPLLALSILLLFAVAAHGCEPNCPG
uniref:Hydrophobic seed protein domain-containing protein n=1 Tax=Oryza punctata TaxID=4537 RepID=A0A0E0M6S2_ORYPU